MRVAWHSDGASLLTVPEKARELGIEQSHTAVI